LLFITTDSVDLASGAYAVVAGATAAAVGGVFGIGLGILAAIVMSAGVGAVGVKLNKPGANDPIAVVLATFGIAIFFESMVLTVFGKDPMIRQPFDVYWNLAGIRMSPQAAINIAVGLAILVALYVLIYFTPLGRIMRASAVNPLGASLAGIPVRRVWYFTYILGGLLASIAGILVLYTTGMSYNSGLGLVMSGFCAAILFGVYSPLRGFMGGIAVGMVQALAAGYLSGGWVTAAPMLFTLLVLASGRMNRQQVAGGRA